MIIIKNMMPAFCYLSLQNNLQLHLKCLLKARLITDNKILGSPCRHSCFNVQHLKKN